MKIKVNFSESDLQCLMDGEAFEWEMGGVNLYLYNEDKHPLLCEVDGCFELQVEDGTYCQNHTK